MKTAFSTLAAALALALGSAAFAAPADNTPAVTYWDIAQENLVREFSQGLGVRIADAHPVLLARAETAAAGPTADTRARHRDDHPRARSHLHHTKAKKHSH